MFYDHLSLGHACASEGWELSTSLNQSALGKGLPSVYYRQSVLVPLRLYKLGIRSYQSSFAFAHSFTHYLPSSLEILQTNARRSLHVFSGLKRIQVQQSCTLSRFKRIVHKTQRIQIELLSETVALLKDLLQSSTSVHIPFTRNCICTFPHQSFRNSILIQS